MNGTFLAFNSPELTDRRTALFYTLLKAGMQVFPSDISFNPEEQHVKENIGNAAHSLHVMGIVYGTTLINGKSLEELQYAAAMAKLKANPSFRMFIWFPYQISEMRDERQKSLISQIRNNVTEGVFFSNMPSAIQLVDDLRIHLTPNEKHVFDVKETDIFLAYNQLDDGEASGIIDMLSDIVPVEKLNIVQDSDLDYSEFCAQQICKCKLAVVYFKESADWALPFTQQIWKKVGGASSHTPILLIGDEDPESNVNKKFKAPKVVSLIVAGELIPLEIKVQYDKVLETEGI